MKPGWTEVALGDVALQMRDGPFGSNLKSSHYVDDGVRVIRLQNIGIGEFVDGDAAYISEEHFQSLPKHHCEPGDVLIATLGDPNVRACVLPKELPRALNKADCLQLRCDPTVADRRYIMHVINSRLFQQRAAGLAHGQTRTRVSMSQLRQATVPLPPLEEQRRIAAILDKADDLLAKRRAAVTHLDSLTPAIFDSTFSTRSLAPIASRPVSATHPNGWSWVSLSDLADLATGHTPDRDRPEFWNGGIPWISLTEIRDLDGRIADTTQLEVSDAGIANSSSVVLPRGTVCLSRTASIGFVTVMGKPMSTSQDFVNWICSDQLRPTYLMNALIRSRPQLRSLSSGSTHKTIHMRVAERLRVLLPPISAQEAFEQKMQGVAVLRGALEGALTPAANVAASLHARAFRGDL